MFDGGRVYVFSVCSYNHYLSQYEAKQVGIVAAQKLLQLSLG
jgi:hypothetical protein